MISCSFFGHRNTVATPELCEKLRKTILYLIEEKGVRLFLFGSRSRFDELCLKTVTELQKKHPEIKRVYVRSQYPYIGETYKDYLMESYDDTLMPSKVEKAGKASYVERNEEMINASDFCVFYYNENYVPNTARNAKSGTRLAYQYATRKSKDGTKTIINLYRRETQ